MCLPENDDLIYLTAALALQGFSGVRAGLCSCCNGYGSCRCGWVVCCSQMLIRDKVYGNKRCRAGNSEQFIAKMEMEGIENEMKWS